MSTALLVVGGVVVAVLVTALISTVAWYFETTIYEPMTNNDMARHNKVSDAIRDFWWAFFAAVGAVPLMLSATLYGILVNVVQNFWKLAVLMLVLMAGMGVMQYHHELYRAELIVSQCIIMPFCNHFLFPLLNIARIAFNTGIILWDFGVDLYAFYEWGPLLTFIKCTIHTTEATDLFAYLANIGAVFAQDISAWFSAGFMTSDFDIVNTLDAIGLFTDTLIGPFTCLCRTLNFIFVGASTWARMPDLHYAINCLLNFFIKLAQIPIITMMSSPHRPDFEEATLRACCTLKSTANVAQYTVLLIAEIFWGVFTNAALPTTIRRVLSVKWARIVAEPLCGGARFVNMTFTALVHYDDLAQASGVGYFQFGHVIDEFKGSAGFLASVFTLMNNDAQATVDQGLLAILNAIAFLLEWVPGNIYYWLYGGPLPLYPAAPYGSFVNFLKYYFPNYWLLPGFNEPPSTYVYTTALSATFLSLFQLTQALGNLFANLLGMEPLGGIVQHTLNCLICLVRILVNLTSFIFTIVTFDKDIRTTARQVDTDSLFNEMYFLSGSLGDFSRQFAQPDPLTNLTCQISADESQNNVFCCAGNLIERLGDVVTVGLQQWIHFLQDLLTLPTGNVIFCIAFIGFNHSLSGECLRIPDMSTALFLLDAALCDFTCTIFSIIPMLTAFQCQFPLPVTPTDPHVPPQPPKPCGHVSTCVSILVCRILRLFLAPLIIMNTWTSMTIQGVSYSDFTVLGSFVLKVLCNIIADALAAFGLLVNCTLCAFVGTGVDCDDSIYQLFVSLGNLIKLLPMIFTRLFMVVFKLVLTLLEGLFGGDPVTAFIQFAVGILTDLFGGLGTAVVNFLSSFLNAIGLGFLGDFIKVLWRGFCPVLQLLLNSIIVVFKIITFGTVQLNFVNFCCDGSPTCQPSSRKRFGMEDDTAILDGVLNVNLDNWLAATVQLISWEEDNPCNQTMAQYAGYSWNNLTEWEQNDVLYCLMKPYWLMRDDNQTQLSNSTCDWMMIEYNNTNWTTIDVLSKATIIECMWSRLYVDAVRHGTGVMWLPQDILTNPYRKFVFGAQFAQGLLIYWQYFSDKQATSEQFLSPTYQNNWAGMGLYTGFYQNITTVDQILQFRDHYRLKDYFQWNNASQYEAVDAVSIGFWNFTNQVLQSLLAVANANYDNQLDPTQYLQFGYSMGSATAGLTNSVYGLLSEVFYAAQNISAYWSNPANVKKRGDAYAILQAGSRGMWKSAVDQLTMMGIDYRMSKLNESRYWAGNCSVDEGERFMAEYNHWVHHDERSWAYHLSRWWANNKETLLTPHPIANPRDGQRRLSYNQSEHLFSYTDSRGRLVAESGRARVNRLLGGLNTGSEQSNRRWNAVGNLLGVVKERIYVNVIRNNLEYAVNYMNRVYVRGGGGADQENIEATGEAIETPHHSGDADLLAKYYEHKSAAESIWVRTEAPGPESPVSQKKLRAQQTHCERDEYKNDGLCKDYHENKLTAAEAKTTRRTVSISERKNYYDEITRTAINGRPYEVTGGGGGPILNNRHPKGVILKRDSVINAMRRTHFVTASVLLADSFIDLTCYTNITFDNSTLCDECFIVDQALGRVETGLGWVNLYYSDGQYRRSLNVSMAYFDYAADDNAYVIVGDGPELSVHGFPGYDGTWYYNLRYLGDDTANKTRFDDVLALIRAATNVTQNSTTNSTAPFVDITHDYFYMNAWVFYVLLLFFGTVWNLIIDFLVFMTGADPDGNVSTGFGVFFIEWFFLCDWLTGEDYRGTRKRFSVGETILMFSVVWVGFSVIFYLTIQFSLFSVLSYLGTSVLITFSFFRSISNNFSFLCLPGLDAMLADDLFYALVFNFMTKCSWFLAFLIKNEEYDNNTCAACENAGGWDILNCVTERGFGDIFANAIFMLQHYWPESLQWVRESRAPPVAMLYQIPYINQRINAFAHVDMSNRANYRQYMGCNYIITLFWNLFFAVVFLYLLSQVWPIFVALFSISILFLNVLYRFWVMMDLIGLDLFASRTAAPFTNMGLVETPVSEHIDEVDVPDETDPNSYDEGVESYDYNDGTNYSAPRQMRTRYSFNEDSMFNFKTMRNLAQRVWDNMGFTERKQR